MKKIWIVPALLMLSVKAYALEEETRSVTTATAQQLENLEDMHARAERLIATGQIPEAIDVYWEIILSEPDDEVAYVNLGNLYLIAGDTDRAKEAFQNAVHINPGNESALIGLRKIENPDELPVSAGEIS